MTSDSFLKIEMRVSSVEKTGEIVERSVKVNVELDTGRFWCLLPPYVAKVLQVDEISTNQGVDGLREKYESVCEQYQRKVLASKITTRIGFTPIKFQAGPTMNVQHDFVFGFVMRDVTTAGNVLLLSEDAERTGEVLLSDTPEIRAKLERLLTSFKAAAEALHGIKTAEDPDAYLLAILEPQQATSAPAPAPVQAELPLANDIAAELAALEAQVGQVAQTVSSTADDDL